MKNLFSHWPVRVFFPTSSLYPNLKKKKSTQACYSFPVADKLALATLTAHTEVVRILFPDLKPELVVSKHQLDNPEAYREGGDAGTRVAASKGVSPPYNFVFVSRKASKAVEPVYLCLVFGSAWPSSQVRDVIVQLPSWCTASPCHPTHWFSISESHSRACPWAPQGIDFKRCWPKTTKVVPCGKTADCSRAHTHS